MADFESKLQRLEEIAEQMKSNDVGLIESSQLFEEGLKLSKQLEKELGKVERRIQVLTNKPDQEGEEPLLSLFPEIEDI